MQYAVVTHLKLPCKEFLQNIYNICFSGEIRSISIFFYQKKNCFISAPEKRGYQENIFLFLHINVCCGGSLHHKNIQYNLNGSNMDGSFTVDDSNSFFSPYKILPIAQENKYLGNFSYFIMGFVCCVYSLELPHRGNSNEYCLIKAILMSTLNIQSLSRKSKRFP